jgi:phosphoribosylaminoimidazole-succinocarboxamide synthase
MAMVATDRISAFDVILPSAFQIKAASSTRLRRINLDATKNIVPNWVISTPDQNVTIGFKCEPLKLRWSSEVICGHAAREYKAGKRSLCGVALPEGLKENDKLPSPIITPTHESIVGHDEDISREDI